MSGTLASKDISLHFASKCLSGEEPAQDHVEVVVSLPTFRRPEHLLKTLKSVTAQDTTRKFICLVMENDPDNGEGAKVAEQYFKENDLPGIVINAHRRGNCSTYNAGWYTALEKFKNLRMDHGHR